MLSRHQERTLGPGGLCCLLDDRVSRWVATNSEQGCSRLPSPRGESVNGVGGMDQLMIWEGEFIGPGD